MYSTVVEKCMWGAHTSTLTMRISSLIFCSKSTRTFVIRIIISTETGELETSARRDDDHVTFARPAYWIIIVLSVAIVSGAYYYNVVLCQRRRRTIYTVVEQTFERRSSFGPAGVVDDDDDDDETRCADATKAT